MDVVSVAGFHGTSRAVVPSGRVRMTDSMERVSIPGHCSTGDPRIELIRNGDVVEAIDVFCSCGKHIRLRCSY
jgi:hypothetical protein